MRHTLLRERNFLSLEHMPTPDGRGQERRGGLAPDPTGSRSATKSSNAGRIRLTQKADDGQHELVSRAFIPQALKAARFL